MNEFELVDVLIGVFIGICLAITWLGFSLWEDYNELD
jgi:hypothetical protein